MTMQCAFRHIVITSEDDEVDAIEWCTGAIAKISSGNNLINTKGNGPKYHEKDGAVETKWNADVDKDKYDTY